MIPSPKYRKTVLVSSRSLRHTAVLIAFLGALISVTSSGVPGGGWARLLVPIGHDPAPGVPLTIRGFGFADAMLSAEGWYCYTQGRDPVVLHGQKEADRRFFRPVVTYEIATEDKTKWRKLNVESEESHSDTVTVSPDNPTVNVTIDMEPFRGWIGTY